jgi:predicted ATPase
VEYALQFPAAQLFLERAAAVRSGFRLRDREEALDLARICQRLDGIPLALELAAARVTVLPIPQIAARLGDRFRLLTGGSRAAMPRHQTLRALIDWSYDQLVEAEARLLRQLAVFAGGWTLAAAEAVGADPVSPVESAIRNPEVLDLLDSLVDRSLVLAEESGGDLRYRMLETVREYAREKLREQGEEAVARAAHLACFLGLAEAVGPELRGPDPGAALTQLEAERDNLRAALRFSAEHEAFRLPASPLIAGGEPLSAGEAGLRLGAALWPFWETRGYLSEGRHHLRAALQRSVLPDSAQRAQALLGAARLAHQQFDLDEAESFGQESLAWFRARGDARGMAAALFYLGEAAGERGKRVAAECLFTEALAASRRAGWTQGMALILVRLGVVARNQGETARAQSSMEEGRALAEALGDAPTLALSFHELASLAASEGDDARARSLLEQGLEIWRRLGHKRATAEALTALGRLAERQEDRTGATSYLEQAAAIFRELGNRMKLVWTLLDLGSVHYRGGAYASARALYEESLGMSRELDEEYCIAAASNNLGMACFHLGDPIRAQALHREALALYVRDGSAEGIAWALEQLGVVTAQHGDPQRAARLLGAAAAAWAKFGKESTAWEASDLGQAAAAVREKLEAEAWESAWQAGRAMAQEEAIAYALEDAGA